MHGAAVCCLRNSWNLPTFNLHATHATHPNLRLVQTDIIYFQPDHLLAQRFVYNDCTQALSYNGTALVGALGGCTVSQVHTLGQHHKFFVRYTRTYRRLMKHGCESKDQMSLIQVLGYTEKLQKSNKFATDCK